MNVIGQFVETFLMVLTAVFIAEIVKKVVVGIIRRLRRQKKWPWVTKVDPCGQPMVVKATAGSDIGQGDAVMLSEDGFTVIPTSKPDDAVGYAVREAGKHEDVEISMAPLPMRTR